MQFLFILELIANELSEVEIALLPAETQCSRTLYGNGIIRQIWSRADKPGACILVEAENRESALAEIHSLPLVSCGALSVTDIPLRPYSGFLPDN